MVCFSWMVACIFGWFLRCYLQMPSKKYLIIKRSLEEILPSYEKLRSVCVHVRDAEKSRLTVACVGTLGAARLRRGCGACAARLRRVCGADPRRDWGIAFGGFFGVRGSIGECNCRLRDALAGSRVQRSRTGKQCAAYYWGMQLQSARRIGRRFHGLRTGKACAAYYWGMQLQIARRIGRRVQRSR